MASKKCCACFFLIVLVAIIDKAEMKPSPNEALQDNTRPDDEPVVGNDSVETITINLNEAGNDIPSVRLKISMDILNGLKQVAGASKIVLDAVNKILKS